MDDQRDGEVVADEVAEALDEGGGCVETWEALCRYRRGDGDPTADAERPD